MSDRFDFSKHSLKELCEIARMYEINNSVAMKRPDLIDAIKNAALDEQENAATGNDVYYQRMLDRIKDGTFDRYLNDLTKAIMDRRLIAGQRRSVGIKAKTRTKLS